MHAGYSNPQKVLIYLNGLIDPSYARYEVCHVCQVPHINPTRCNHNCGVRRGLLQEDLTRGTGYSNVVLYTCSTNQIKLAGIARMCFDETREVFAFPPDLF